MLRVFLRKMRRYIYKAIDYCTPFITHRIYQGYVLFYSRGTGIVDRLRFLSPHPIYEPLVSEKLTTYLQLHEKPVLYDIGANIGLIMLYIKHHVPDTLVYCFEPGMHQRALLELTVASNTLGTEVRVFPYAVSDAAGETSFTVNTSTVDAAGDGFLDTGRSLHPTHTTVVETVRLDDFITTHKILPPTVIKLDIEGAELWALEGMRRTIEIHQPIIIFEMSTLNLAAYPHSVSDLFAFFASIHYTITTLDDRICTNETFATLAYDDDMYVATPSTQ